MNCEIIKDLIPLCIDGCCSSESEKIVKEHIENCDSCKAVFEDMKAPTNAVVEPKAPVKFNKLNDWKASILQSVLLFVSIAIITTGVALEAATPSSDWGNGFYAFNIVIPTMAFMLSLANWYFVKLYKSRTAFAACSFVSTIVLTILASVWGNFHYEVNLVEIFSGISFSDALGILQLFAAFGSLGVFLTVIYSIMSLTLSDLYAKMLGKE